MAGNEGHEGHEGHAGYVGLAGGEWTFADRVDLPFLTLPQVREQFLARDRFSDRNWSPNWAAWPALVDFSQTNWKARTTVPAPPNTAVTRKEIENDLQPMVLDERPDALGEIFSQADEFMSYFLAVLGATPNSHPATLRLLNMANLVAIFVSMYWKRFHNRPRPSHLCPALYPPLQVPGHAAYPSGHATQAHLFARCLKEILPTQAQRDGMGIVLNALASRIARNREIAGLHYPSDSAAGAALAQAIFTMIMDENAMPHEPNEPSKFKAAMDSAKLEWA